MAVDGEEPVTWQRGAEARSEFTLLPPKEGLCPDCARAHDPALPHDKLTLYFQTKFNIEHGRAATWDDAMAHCTPEVRQSWRAALLVRGQWDGPISEEEQTRLRDDLLRLQHQWENPVS